MRFSTNQQENSMAITVTKQNVEEAKRLDMIRRYLEACPQTSDPILHRAIVRAQNLAAKNLSLYCNGVLK